MNALLPIRKRSRICLTLSELCYPLYDDYLGLPRSGMDRYKEVIPNRSGGPRGPPYAFKSNDTSRVFCQTVHKKLLDGGKSRNGSQGMKGKDFKK